jgi:hypothetical protein
LTPQLPNPNSFSFTAYMYTSAGGSCDSILCL